MTVALPIDLLLHHRHSCNGVDRRATRASNPELTDLEK